MVASNRFLEVVVLLTVAGCATTVTKPIADCWDVQADPTELWQVCQAELRSRGFRLDRVDRRSGSLKSHPRISSQWFEFWGRDVVTASDWAESSLHTIRRTVELDMTRQAPHCCRLRCRVAVERLTPEPLAVAGSLRLGDVLKLTAGNLPALTDPFKDSQPQAQWAPLADDQALAAAILSSIETALHKDN